MYKHISLMIILQEGLHSKWYLLTAWQFTSNLNSFLRTNSTFFTLKCYLIVYSSVTKAHVAMDDDDYETTKFTTASVTNAPTHTVSSSETIWCSFCIISETLNTVGRIKPIF